MLTLTYKAIRCVSDYFFKSEDYDTEINDVISKIESLTKIHEKPETSDKRELKSNNENECYYKTGYITTITNDFVLVDDFYVCDNWNIHHPSLKIGDKVYFLAFMKKNKNQNSCKIISVIKDDWDEINIETESKGKSPIMTKTLIAIVTTRKGRKLYCDPDNICIDLDKVEANFIPSIGDWLQLESTIEVNTDKTDLAGELLQIDRFQPLRSKLEMGTITNYNTKTDIGIIDNSIVFNKIVCETNYIPNIGDKVVSDSIESNQGIYLWRALSVVPIQIAKKYGLLSESHYMGLEDQTELNNLISNKYGIVISNNLRLNLKILQEQSIEILLSNNSNDTFKICNSYFKYQNKKSQLSLLKPLLDSQITLNPLQTTTYTFKCRGTNIGTTKELFIFNFGNFEIGRIFEINVDMVTSSKRNETHSYQEKRENHVVLPKQYDESNEIIIPGLRPIKSPAFVKVKNLPFPIPKYIWTVVLDALKDSTSKSEYNELIRKSIPILNERLCFETYEYRFHALLYLEEIAQIMNIQRYSMSSAVMEQCGEYLVLEVAGLLEKRPSLLIGDRAIISFLWDSSSGNLKYEGFIHKVSSNKIYLKFNSKFHNDYNGENCQVSFVQSNSTIRQSHNALKLALTRLGPKFLFPTRVHPKEPKYYLEEVLTSNDVIGKKIENGNNPFGENSLTNKHDNNLNKNIWSQIKKRKLIWFDENLNHYQKEAVRNILLGLARPLPYVIFGPPGTGKTVTLCETILQILTIESDSRLLIATPSNNSANIIAERLLNSNILKPGDMVRLIAFHYVDSDEIPPALLPYCTTIELAEEGTKCYSKYTDKGTRINCGFSILGRHRITIGTCATIGKLHNIGFPRGHFSHVLIDEAGQLTEPEILIPLNFINSNDGQVIFAGDPQQLGPVVTSKAADHFDLGISFLCRLLKQFPYQKDSEGFENGYDPRLVTKLLINYRSLPEILYVPNLLFYNSELLPKIHPSNSDEAKLLELLKDELPLRNGIPPALVFHGIDGNNIQDVDSPSWYNLEEVAQVYFYVVIFYKRGLTADDIGIITPYQKQAMHLRESFFELDVPIPKISSVEGFQGDERKVIILSTVRSSNNLIQEDIRCSLGFVSSPKRLNVAITRARALLIIIGNPRLLLHDSLWRTIISRCVNENSYIGCDLNNSLSYDS